MTLLTMTAEEVEFLTSRPPAEPGSEGRINMRELISDELIGKLWAEVLAQSSARKEERRKAFEEAIALVRAEPELPGPMPREAVEQFDRLGQQEYTRGTVRATKISIVKALAAARDQE